MTEQESVYDSETSYLDLSYSLEFKGDNDGNYDDRLDGGIQSYLYEPMEDTSSGSN